MMIGKIKNLNQNFLFFFISITILISSYYFNNINLFSIYVFSHIASNISTKYGLNLSKKLNLFQNIREEGPSIHETKKNIPTMGGIFFIPVFFISLLIIEFPNLYLKTILFLTFFGYFIIGIFDDLLSIKKKTNLGLTSKQKLFFQLLISSILIIFGIQNNLIESNINIFSSWDLNIGNLIIPISFITIAGFSNAVNLTDGLDGLASGCSAIAFCGLGTEILLTNDETYLGYGLLCYSMAGLCLGFLRFNNFPAKIFMGDAGSLCIGAILGSISILTNSLISTIIISGIFILETISVILQVAFFKITKKLLKKGKRLFLMSPLHHHFELKGFKEQKIVENFWKINICFAILGIVLKIYL